MENLRVGYLEEKTHATIFYQNFSVLKICSTYKNKFGKMLLSLVICKNKIHNIFIKMLYIFKISKLTFYELQFMKKKKERKT